MNKRIYTLLAALPLLQLAACKKDVNPAEGTLNDQAALYVVRDTWHKGDVALGPSTLGGASFTTGTVISDASNGNIASGSFIIQSTTLTANQATDLTRGIIIDMGSGTQVPYVPGDSLMVNIAGATLKRINGKLTIQGVTPDKVTKLAEGRQVYVRPVNLAILNNMFDVYESTLVAVHADIKDYSAGQTFSGLHPIGDNTGNLFLHTTSGAAFAGAETPQNARFMGIVGYKNDNGNDTAGAQRTISLRSLNDTSFVSGTIYSGFPESFESPDFTEKSSYNMTATSNNIDLATGNWKLQQAILGNTSIRDRFNLPGKQCIRMQQNLTSSAYVQMNFDLPDGASKVTVFYGKYYTDPRSTFRLEYSIDGGTTWVVAGANVNDMPEQGSYQASFMVNVSGPVRFRINKLGLGASSSTVQNGRLCIEDIVVYKQIQ